MAHKNAQAGHKWEREVAAFLTCPRHWANSGATVDNSDPWLVIQCKSVKQLPLGEVMALCEQARVDGLGKNRLGLVALNQRVGSGGKRRMPVVAMTWDQFRVLLDCWRRANPRDSRAVGEAT